jgi:tocopherol cyclase
VICGVCRDARGTWAMVTLAAEPGGFERTVVFDEAAADVHGLGVCAGGLRAGAGELRVDLGDGARLQAAFSGRRDWPRRAWGALGPAHLVPGLGQYWTPHLLGAGVRGEALGRSLDGCLVYAEKNWGARFAHHWWWGQAPLDDDAGVAFAGGRLGPAAPTAVVAWAPHGLVRLAPPCARTVARSRAGEWRIRARSAYSRVELEGDAAGSGLRLPNPIPAERRLEVRSTHHLLGRVRVTVWRGRRIWLRGETPMAALEDGRGGAER